MAITFDPVAFDASAFDMDPWDQRLFQVETWTKEPPATFPYAPDFSLLPDFDTGSQAGNWIERDIQPEVWLRRPAP